MSVCRQCDRPIIWAKNAKGHRIALDAFESVTGVRFVIATYQGELHAFTETRAPGYRRHLDTCAARKRNEGSGTFNLFGGDEA